ncbi:MAG: AtpZ/AtpI family protein [Flexilinea sp.]
MSEKPGGKAFSRGKDIRIFKWAIILFSSVAVTTCLVAIGTLFLGRKLDAHFETGYWITLVIGLFGLIIILGATLMIALRSARKINDIMDERKKQEGEFDGNRKF